MLRCATLMADLLATASEIKMRQTIEDTIAAVRIVAARRPNPDIDGATVRQVANELGLDRSAVHRRLKAAESEGHIANLENRKGYPARYKPTDDGGGGGLMDIERPGGVAANTGRAAARLQSRTRSEAVMSAQSPQSACTGAQKGGNALKIQEKTCADCCCTPFHV